MSDIIDHARKNTRNDLLKTIGIVSMFADHVGLIFFPQVSVFRIIGRLALPIFAFGIANGYKCTSNLKKYFFRLLIFGAIAQVPFALAVSSQKLNILFTLAYGLAAIYLFDNKKYILFSVLILLSVVIPMDYGYFGVLAIFSFYFFKDKLALVAFLAILTLVYSFETRQSVQLYFLAGALLVLSFPAGLFRIRLPKHFFYWFYPAHLALLFAIKYFLA